MSKLVLITEEELENLIKKVINEALSPLLVRGALGDMEPVPDILTLKQASAFLNMGTSTVYGHTSKRQIPHYKRGKKLYFKRDDLLEWITQGKQKTKVEILSDWEEKQSGKIRGKK